MCHKCISLAILSPDGRALQNIIMSSAESNECTSTCSSNYFKGSLYLKEANDEMGAIYY